MQLYFCVIFIQSVTYIHKVTFYLQAYSSISFLLKLSVDQLFYNKAATITAGSVYSVQQHCCTAERTQSKDPREGTSLCCFAQACCLLLLQSSFCHLCSCVILTSGARWKGQYTQSYMHKACLCVTAKDSLRDSTQPEMVNEINWILMTEAKLNYFLRAF